MRSLLIDLRKGFGDFDGYKLSKFPDNSIKLTVARPALDLVTVTTSLRTNEDLIALGIILDYFEDNGVPVQLDIHYLMYQQDDRRFSPYESFGLKFVARFLNSFKNLLTVNVFHPHSDKVELIDRCKIFDNTSILDGWLNEMNPDAVWIIPDSGAFKSQFKQIQSLKWQNFLPCMKSRDHATGGIKTVVPIDDLEGKECFIVDDICLGGRTAIGIAEQLVEKNCGKLYLMVSHGVFNHGVDHLAEYFDCIYTTDSICTEVHPQVKITKL